MEEVSLVGVPINRQFQSRVNFSRVAKWVRSNGVSVQKALPSSENQLDSLDEQLTGSSDDTTKQQ